MVKRINESINIPLKVICMCFCHLSPKTSAQYSYHKDMIYVFFNFSFSAVNKIVKSTFHDDYNKIYIFAILIQMLYIHLLI